MRYRPSAISIRNNSDMNWFLFFHNIITSGKVLPFSRKLYYHFISIAGFLLSPLPAA